MLRAFDAQSQNRPPRFGGGLCWQPAGKNKLKSYSTIGCNQPQRQFCEWPGQPPCTRPPH